MKRLPRELKLSWDMLVQALIELAYEGGSSADRYVLQSVLASDFIGAKLYLEGQGAEKKDHPFHGVWVLLLDHFRYSGLDDARWQFKKLVEAEGVPPEMLAEVALEHTKLVTAIELGDIRWACVEWETIITILKEGPDLPEVLFEYQEAEKDFRDNLAGFLDSRGFTE